MSTRPPALTAGPFGIGYAIAGFVISVVCALAPPMILAMTTGAADGAGDAASAAGATPLGVPLQFLSMFLLAAIVVRLLRRRAYRPDNLGLTYPSRASAWLLGVAGGVAFVAFGQLVTKAFASLGEAGTKVAAQVGLGESLTRDVMLILSMAVLAPLGEELVYRGLMFRGLFDVMARSGKAGVRRAAFIVAALASSLTFAIAHGGEGQSTQLIPLTVFGLIAAFLYWWTGSMYVAVFAHSVTNMINVVILAVGGNGLTNPVLWVLVASTPLISVGLLALTHGVLGGGAAVSAAPGPAAARQAG